ncbi:MAG: hypothetical protein ACSHX8_09920 [Opitutaceae bacterium]
MIFDKDIKFSKKERAKPCRVVFNKGAFSHRFGGAPTDQGAIPKGSKKAMLKILELDLTDPLCPVECDDPDIKTLPLYYPLCFDFGGGEVQYTLTKKRKIKLFNQPEEDDDYEEYPYPEELPEKEFSLVELTYEEFRALTVSRVDDAYKTPESDKIVLNRIEESRMIQLGGFIYPMQGEITWKCKNKKCEWSKLEATVDVIATIPSEPIEGLDIWGADGYGPEIYFCLCRLCGTIFCVNRCT